MSAATVSPTSASVSASASASAASVSLRQKEEDENIFLTLRHQVIHKYISKERECLLEPGAFRALSQFILETEGISYETFVQLRKTLPALHSKYFSAKVFLALGPHPSSMCISSEKLVRFIDQDIEMKRILLDLLEYSLLNSSPDYITSEQLQAYIYRRIPDLDPEHQMVESFHEFYTCTAVQRFLFHVDTRNSNKLSIRQIMTSQVLKEFLDLLQLQQQIVSLIQDENLQGRDNSDEMRQIQEKLDINWFSGTNAVNIYTTFLNLDVDQNGLLSLEEASEFNGFSANGLNFTRTAWRRIFEELVLFAPFELDYRGFVQLVLALDDIQLAEDIERNADLAIDSGGRGVTGLAGLKFFWNVVDFNRSNLLSPMKIKTFYSDIEEYMSSANQVIPEAHAIITEIYDMLAYKHDDATGLNVPGPGFQHLRASKRVAVALMMLLDVNSFWRYENRENPGISPIPPPPTSWQHQQNPASATNEQHSPLKSMDDVLPNSPPRSSTSALTLGKRLEDDEEPGEYSFDELKAEDSDLSTSMKLTRRNEQDLPRRKKIDIVYDDEGDEYDFT